jgi:hypothetical protein
LRGAGCLIKYYGISRSGDWRWGGGPCNATDLTLADWSATLKILEPVGFAGMAVTVRGGVVDWETEALPSVVMCP